jgi:1-acyl-sn-glycerol-3-phosphate acyltransferase
MDLSPVANAMLRAQGWQSKIEAPLPERCVIVAEPHTSNWDGWFMVLGTITMRLNAKWMIKAEHQNGPIGKFLRGVGAVFVDRGKGGAVQSVIAAFDKGEPMRLSIAASGTRKYTERWRTGFLQIARGAKVPLVLGYVDYKNRIVGIGPTLDSSRSDAELEAEMAAFYAPMIARVEANKSPVRFAKQAADDETADE